MTDIPSSDKLAAAAKGVAAAESVSEVEARRLLSEALERTARAERALAAERERVERLLALTTVDEATGLLNRRGFEDGLLRSLARARRYGEVGALMLVDLVNLAEIVEEKGQAAGGYALSATAAILRGRFREVDYIARLERGRFALLLPVISQEDARRRAAMLKSQIAKQAISWQGHDLLVEARLGLVHYGQRDAAEDLLERVEAELEERERHVARLRHPAE